MFHTAEHSVLSSQCHATFPSHQASYWICVSFNPRLLLCHLWSPEMDAVFSFYIAFPMHSLCCKRNMIRGTWGLYFWLWSKSFAAVTNNVSVLYRPSPGLINQSFPNLDIYTTKEINIEKTWSCTRHLLSAFSWVCYCLTL